MPSQNKFLATPLAAMGRPGPNSHTNMDNCEALPKKIII